MVESASIKVAGDKFDEAVVKYIRRKHNVLIGDRTAEELKMNIGCVFPRPEEVSGPACQSPTAGSRRRS